MTLIVLPLYFSVMSQRLGRRDGKCADELPDCTNRFPIHGMI